MAAVVVHDDDNLSSNYDAILGNEFCTANSKAVTTSKGLFISSDGELVQPSTCNSSGALNLQSLDRPPKRPHSARDPFPSLLSTGTGLVHTLIQRAANVGASAVVGSSSSSTRCEYGVVYSPLETCAPPHKDGVFCNSGGSGSIDFSAPFSSSGALDCTSSSLIEYSVLPLDADESLSANGDCMLSINTTNDNYTVSPKLSSATGKNILENSLYRRRQVDRVASVHAAMHDRTHKENEKDINNNY
eukprot:Lankesteria_metandrocarpae@DN10351_c0_g1_i1.p1